MWLPRILNQLLLLSISRPTNAQQRTSRKQNLKKR